jgi:cysteinyl-tRNA synthetase
VGFPGWHIECSAMSRKYLGETFDIHGGGMDLLFPHHESEIAQSKGSCGHAPVRYWVHNNMITINGQKMGKSLGNFITLNQLFTGSNPLLEQAYSPMTIRFFILQAHYRSTLDFSNEGLQAAEKGLARLNAAIDLIPRLKPSTDSTVAVGGIRDACFAALNDDLNTAIAISHLFEAVRIVNSVHAGTERLTQSDIELIAETLELVTRQILGLTSEDNSSASGDVDGLMGLVIALRADAKARKDYALSDKIRDGLSAMGYTLKDEKDGTVWSKD